MRIKLLCQPREVDRAVAKVRAEFAVASVGRPIRTGNAGQPGEVAVTIRAALGPEAVAS